MAYYNNGGSGSAFQPNGGGQNNSDEDSQQPIPRDTKWMADIVGSRSPFGVYYTKVCEVLKSRNVPATRLPTREHFMSKMLSFADAAKLERWMAMYVELEAISENEIEYDIGDNQTEEDIPE